jgi:predicted  nucleic acid-binding Zn-ribbon protein
MIRQLTVELSHIRSRSKHIEMETQGFAGHIKQEEEKLYGGKISNPRELEQIGQKISEYRKSQTKLDDELYPLLENEELLSGQIVQMQQRLEKSALEVEGIQKQIREQQLETQIKQEEFQAELETLLPQVPPEWLERYRKIAGSHKGIGMAKLKNNACGACHVSQSDSLLQKVKRGDDQLVFCENCGRILCY